MKTILAAAILLAILALAALFGTVNATANEISTDPIQRVAEVRNGR